MGYQQLMERCNFTQEEAAKRLSRSRSAVANSLRLLNLPDEVIEMVRRGQLSTGHAKVILSLEGEEAPDLRPPNRSVKQRAQRPPDRSSCAKQLAKAPESPCPFVRLCPTRWNWPCARCWAGR
ncbi:MAG: ParB/RepB/Spo0J family partition protein [Oscillospiraceae bacterium]